jgi:hypothetical protein
VSRLLMTALPVQLALKGQSTHTKGKSVSVSGLE